MSRASLPPCGRRRRGSTTVLWRSPPRHSRRQMRSCGGWRTTSANARRAPISAPVSSHWHARCTASTTSAPGSSASSTRSRDRATWRRNRTKAAGRASKEPPLCGRRSFAAHMRLEEIDERLQRRGRLAPARIVQEEADRARRPVFQQRDEPSRGNVRTDKSHGQARQADTIERSAQRQVSVVDDERALHHHLNTLPPLLERPLMDRAAGEALAYAV